MSFRPSRSRRRCIASIVATSSCPIPPIRRVSILVDAQRTKGLELGLNGNITRAWSVAGGYAYQDGEITRSISATAQAGAALAQLPKHSISLWNKYDFTPRLAAALGVIYRGDVFTSTDNLVVLPSWTRVDAAVYYNLTSRSGRRSTSRTCSTRTTTRTPTATPTSRLVRREPSGLR